MKSKKLVIISVISTATLLASVGVASAATNFGNGQAAPKSGFAGSMNSVMSVVAQDLNISTQTLQSDLSSGKSINDIATAQSFDTSKLASDVEAALTANINQAVQAGKMTQDQATKMESNLAQRVQTMLSKTHQAKQAGQTGHTRGNMRASFAGSMNSVMSVVTQDLNISTQTLQSDLSSEKSINDIATAQSFDTSKLASDVEAALTANINQAVQAGKMTQDQATKMESNLAQRVQTMLSQKWHSHTRNNSSSQNTATSNS
ncbi:hypothetical protein DEAC_c43610 [Desulfosporosinus acididurans]|uniref:Uncharacterized protein n=1 Tax=Desulfosporosinus acididurans TaxID=476652 RepID=A0A0J1IG61_9FIRM|nr:hypothetical protein [Desulfosporosinus acididurans]KLU63726.1 hypothetical protein DEAC_c43610 [Desulfosporosinus acididurans]